MLLPCFVVLLFFWFFFWVRELSTPSRSFFLVMHERADVLFLFNVEGNMLY